MEKLNKLEAYCTQNLARSLNLYIMKLRDLIGNSERTTDGIKRILTTRDENGNLNILKSVEAESAVQKFMRIGYVDTKGKTQQQVKQELEARFGSLAKKGVKVYFYGEKDIDTSNLDNATKTKLLANGFAITEDGTVWINKEHVDSEKVIDFNTLTQHEISHIIFERTASTRHSMWKQPTENF